MSGCGVPVTGAGMARIMSGSAAIMRVASAPAPTGFRDIGMQLRADTGVGSGATGSNSPLLGVQLLAVAAEDSDIRLDRWFRRHFPDLGHGRLEKLLRTGH